MKKALFAALITAFVMTAGVAYAKMAPKHPNLVAAQVDLGHAWDRVLAAQKANEFDLGGHAQKAKEAMDVANKEIKLAIEAANK